MYFNFWHSDQIMSQNCDKNGGWYSLRSFSHTGSGRSSRGHCIVGYSILLSVLWLCTAYFGKCRRSCCFSMHRQHLHTAFNVHTVYCRNSKYTLLNKANMKVTFAKHFTSVRWHFWVQQHIEQKIIIIMLSWTHTAADTSSKKKSCFRRGAICNALIWKQSLYFFKTTFIKTVHFDLIHKITQNSCCLLVKLRD